jgi:hypothetical protein
LDAVDAHLPEEGSGGIGGTGGTGGSIDGGVVEGEVLFEVQVLLLEGLDAQRDGSFCKGTHQHEPVLGIHSKYLLHSCVYIL